jgi:hypothetical protein
VLSMGFFYTKILMRIETLIITICIPVLIIGQNKTSVSLSINYPLFNNESKILNNNVLHASLYNEVLYNEKPGISINVSRDIPFIFNMSLSIGLGFDWLNYGIKYKETNLLSGNFYESNSLNPVIERYDAKGPTFTTTILYASLPINCKYAILGGKAIIAGGIVTCFQLTNNQYLDYSKFIDSGGLMRIEKYSVNIKEGLNNLLLLLNVGCEYNLRDDLAVTFSYKAGLTPLYESKYIFVENSPLHLFSLGAKYCFPW